MSDESLRQVLAGIGLQPTDVPVDLLAIIAQHIASAEQVEMGDVIRAERDAIGERHRLRSRAIFGLDADDDDSPPPTPTAA